MQPTPTVSAAPRTPRERLIAEAAYYQGLQEGFTLGRNSAQDGVTTLLTNIREKTLKALKDVTAAADAEGGQ